MILFIFLLFFSLFIFVLLWLPSMVSCTFFLAVTGKNHETRVTMEQSQVCHTVEPFTLILIHAPGLAKVFIRASVITRLDFTGRDISVCMTRLTKYQNLVCLIVESSLLTHTLSTHTQEAGHRWQGHHRVHDQAAAAEGLRVQPFSRL